MGVPAAQRQDARAGLPVVAVEHVHGSRLGTHRLQRGAPQEREPGAVVGIVTRCIAVQPGTREAWVVLHEPQPVAVAGTAQQLHRHPLEGLCVARRRVAAHGHLQPERLGVRGRRDARDTGAGRHRPRGRGRPAHGPGHRPRRPGHRSWRTVHIPRPASRYASAQMVRGRWSRGTRKPVHARAESCSMPDRGVTPPASPRCPSPRSACRRSSRAWNASRTTCTGRGTPRRVPCSAVSTGPHGAASGAPWRSSRPAGTGRRCWTTPTSWSSTGPCSPTTTSTDRTAPTTGSTGTTAGRSMARSPTSAPSSGCTSRWASTPVAWACSRATTARPPRTWPCRSWPSACSTATATSGNPSMPTATRSMRIPTWTSPTCRCSGSRTRSATR